MKEVIQGLWIGSRLSLMEQLSLCSFLAHGHEYHLYVYEKVKNVPKDVILKDASQIISQRTFLRYQHASYTGFTKFSDLFRFKLLSKKGGFWSDLDVVCLKPFDFNSDYVFASENTIDKRLRVQIGIMKVPPNSKFMKICYQTCREKARRLDPQKMGPGEIGARLITPLILKFGLKSYIKSPTTFNPLDFWDFEDLIRPDTKFKIPKESYTIHLWNQLWRKGLPPIMIYRLSEKLKLYSEFYLKTFKFFKELMKSRSSLSRTNQKIKYDKDRTYSEETLYGRLQAIYLKKNYE